MMPAQNGNTFLPEEDMLNTILNELKRTVREYTTATTESSCPDVRSMFTTLTSETLKMQGEMYQLIEQNKQYPSAVPHAMKSDVQKQLQEIQKNNQKTREFTGQKTAGLGAYSHAPNVPEHRPNVPAQ
ncbi:spore coat protein [Paenibacillus sp. DMB20]|uniref:spore coat protein n=1 Tax=Paenibacillus sp. DMB20 TaxID=1642570 RepID=UPI002E0E81E0